MNPKPQVAELRKQQIGLNREMKRYAKEDRRNREAYLTKVQKIDKILVGTVEDVSVEYPTRKGQTILCERKMHKEKEVKK